MSIYNLTPKQVKKLNNIKGFTFDPLKPVFMFFDDNAIYSPCLIIQGIKKAEIPATEAFKL